MGIHTVIKFLFHLLFGTGTHFDTLIKLTIQIVMDEKLELCYWCDICAWLVVMDEKLELCY